MTVLARSATARTTALRLLADSECLHRSVLDVLDEGVITVDRQGRLMHANRAACATLNLDVVAARAERFWWRAIAAGGSDVSACATVLTTGEGIHDVGVEATRPDGTTVQLSVNYEPLFDDAGGVDGMVLSFRDVTELELAGQRAATERDFFQTTLDSLSAHIAVLGVHGEIVMTNRAWVRFARANGAAPPGPGASYLTACDAAVGDSDARQTAAALRAIMSGSASSFALEYPCHSPTTERWFEGQFTVRHRDGATFPACLRTRAMRDGDGNFAGRTSVIVDLSAEVESAAALRAAGNYLRAVADSVGEGLFTLDTEGCVTYMNDEAEKLLGWTQEELHGRVMHGVAHTHRLDGTALPIAECPIMGAVRDGCTRRIDDGLFIRRDGRELPVAYTAAPFETSDGVHCCVVLFEDISERKARDERLQRDVAKLAWIARIQDALAEDRFLLYAQPIVDLRSGEFVQRELLLRIREPDGEIVGPSEYLGIAEQYGLIGEIDRWVIGRGAELAATGSPVQINLSARSIGDQAVLEHIDRCVEESGADPALLVFEVTETALIEDEAAARAFAEHLHELGCKLALDDFGTGYAGFAYLKQLPLDFLKIDIEFVRDLAVNPVSSHVVEAVVALARGFKLQTVAEGVEDAETYDLLRELGVDFAQGFHIARPGPLDEAAIGRKQHMSDERDGAQIGRGAGRRTGT